MEFFLNLVWVVLATGLVILWALAHWSPARITQEDWRRQAIAMGALLLVLLPVISLTDDLQAWAAPAETEHSRVMADAAPRGDHTLPALWVHSTGGIVHPVLQAWSRFEFVRKAPVPRREEAHPIENRPPPRLC